MFLFFAKILFSIVNPKVVFVFGQYRMTTMAALMPIFSMGKLHVSVSYIHGSSPKSERALCAGLLRFPKVICVAYEHGSDAKRHEFLKRSPKGTYGIVTGAVDIPYGIEVFASEREAAEPFLPFVKGLKGKDGLIVLDDDVTFRDMKNETEAEVKTFGFHDDADVFISNVSLLTDEKFLERQKGIGVVLNAKLNTQKQSLPLWLYNVAGRSHLYGVAAAAALGLMFDMSILDISEVLKSYRPPRGYLRVLEGRKGITILDDSADATLFSMMESIEILDSFAGKKRIAVIGDIAGLSETEAAMRNITVKAIKYCDILVAVGSQAMIVREEASSRGFAQEHIHTFVNASEAAIFLRDAVKGSEVILVDGAKELHMEEIVKALV
jgi:UDP-N-acetylmuramyl pentapeptide synthase